YDRQNFDSISLIFGLQHGPDGVHYWHKQYPYCGGVFQSPIDLQTQLLKYDPTMAPIGVWNYNLSGQEQLTLGNNGHAVKLSLPARMYISGLPHRYSAAQLHFHWGSPTLAAGSEHTVNGKRFAAEMHIVHFNSDKYANISVAADKSDGLAVLAVLIEVGEFNPAFDHFLKFINGVKYKDQRVQIPAFNVRSLLPARLDEYYRYDGSLTTPPCYPSVLWTVFRSPVTMSHRQFSMLSTALYSSSAQESASMPLNGNYRTLQKPDQRTILVSFLDGRGTHGSVTEPPPFIRRRLIQQLLSGDLGDLADEGISQLLPKFGRKLGVSKKLANRKNQNSLNENFPMQNTFVPILSKHSQTTSNVNQYGFYEESLCYVSIEEEVIRQLKRSHSGNQLVDALKDTVFPELNLRSYLDCRSDLALPTIRHLLHRRPAEDTEELENSLMKAAQGPRKSPSKQQMDLALGKQAAVQRKPSKARVHRLPKGVEWED
uniref:Carbonic anhydrase n=1 Tax=Scleropages formosus TaxID=113540 RepID=A0A8C9SL05_SCLFO